MLYGHQRHVLSDLVLIYVQPHRLLLLFKDVNGYPTLVTKDSVDGELHGIRNARCSFGPKLHPAVSQYILKSTARVFKEHHELNHEKLFIEHCSKHIEILCFCRRCTTSNRPIASFE